MSSLLEPVSETEMQQFCAEIMKRLSLQRRNEHFCDVILEVGSGDDQAHLKAHRIVLCAASPFFYNALHSEMKEKKEGVIRLNDTSKAVMEEVLEYLYTGHADINGQNAYDLMAAADYFLLPSLKLLSSKFMQQTLSVSNCIMAYYSGVKYHCAELQERARSFVLANFVAVSKSEDFLSLSVDEVEEWIVSDDIVVSAEEEVFMAILRWITNDSEREQSFFELFRHVRFVYVAHHYILKVILEHYLVQSSKQCMALVLDAMREVSNGTEECFLNQSPRSCLKAFEDAIFACGENKTLCYLPSEDKWYAMKSPLCTWNASVFATSPCQGKLFLVGGAKNDRSVKRYDPLVNSWGSSKALKDAIRFPAAVTFQGCVYVIGGLNDKEDRLSTVQKYNPQMSLWQEVPPLGCGRASVCAVADANYIYAIGGSDCSHGPCNVVEKFDPEANSWTKITPTQAKRKHADGVNFPSKIFVIGGIKVSDGSSCEIYNKETDVWTNTESTVAPRYMYHASAVCIKRKIFVFGKFVPNQGNDQGMRLQVYDVDKDEWKPCHHVSLIANGMYKLSALRVLREVLNSCHSF